MHAGKLRQIALAISLSLPSTTDASALVSGAGQIAAVPAWDLQSSAEAGDDLAAISQVGVDTSSWHHVKTSKCTLMGCLLEAGVYNDTHLFYSENLRDVDEEQFNVPWLYRQEFELEPVEGRHFQLLTHGISSKADIYLNGEKVADNSFQAGGFVGHTYDITEIVDQDNALVIQAHPTNYYRDFALGWVDWNPWPADNGTGVWRDVEIKETGPVALGPLRITTNLDSTAAYGSTPANVTLIANAQNLENQTVIFTVTAQIVPESGGEPLVLDQTFTLEPLSSADISATITVENPSIWWPAQWGDQPLYKANLTVTASEALSDVATATFGIRTVTSRLNSHNDITLIVNGQPFQVLGAGYAPDMFLRWDPAKWETEARYALDLGFNTIRLEGKNEHPELYDIADRLGLMIMPGWECCDKWEAWEYNQDLAVPTPVWNDTDYAIANASMRHEATWLLQTHPSVLTYLIGSDYWPDERASPIYVDALESANWQTPILPAASKRGYPNETGPSGMKMEGPYDWVPPNYWYDTKPYSERYGAAFGFGSELGAGVGTPELSSLRKFLSPSDLSDLWRNPDKDLFHMSRETSQFHNRAIYNKALWARWGAPTSLEDYVQKTQIMDYEATRAHFEAFASKWSDPERPATGLIYWMMTGAFPSLHWSLWDYYMHPMGSYFGAKVGSRIEHVAYDYVTKDIYLINRSLGKKGTRSIDIQIMDAVSGRLIHNSNVSATETVPNTSKTVASLAENMTQETVKGVVCLRLVLTDDESGEILSRNVYVLSEDLDTLDWDESEWYVTPVTEYADFKALNPGGGGGLQPQPYLAASATRDKATGDITVRLESAASVGVALFVYMNLVDAEGRDVVPVTWEDNYVSLWPREVLNITARVDVGGKGYKPSSAGGGGGEAVEVRITGKNIQGRAVRIQ